MNLFIERTTCSLVFVIGIAISAHAQPSQTNVLRWTAAVRSAEALSPQPRSYRLFQPADQISLAFTFFNESSSEIIVDTERFRNGVKSRVVVQGDLVTEMLSEPTIRLSGESFSTNALDAIRLEPGRGFGWAMTVRRADGAVFAPGTYGIELTLDSALPSLRTIEGSPWAGRMVTSTTLRLTIAAPATPNELARMHRVVAIEALAENRHADAVTAFTRALQSTPSDPELAAGLGHAYLGLNMYSDAVAAYERSLPAVLGRQSGVPELLALAYVAVADERNAVRVLRLDGKTETQIPARIQELRDWARQRSGR